MESSNTIMASLLDCFRGSGLEAFAALELSLQLLAWAKLSDAETIPLEYRISKSSGAIDSETQLEIFGQLRKLEELGENRAAFEPISANPVEISASATSIAMQAAQSNSLKTFEIQGLPQQVIDTYRHSGLFWVPTEIIELMLKLAGKISGKRIYCPYDMLGLLALQADKAGAAVYIESPLSASIPRLINILTDSSLHTCVGDPVMQPSHVKDGRLEQFDMTLAFPPFGNKYSTEISKQNKFNRFPESTASGSILHIRHIIAQTENRAIIAVPQVILFSRGAEHSLRKDLIEKRMIEAVINLPPALLPFTTVQFFILILKVKGGVKTVRFIDGSNGRFFERDGWGRSRLNGWETLLKAFYNSEDEEIALDVTCQAIAENDYHLEVSRYLLSPIQRKARQYLKKAKVSTLEQLATFVRPSKRILGEGNRMALEVGVGDFGDFGYMTTPQRSVTLLDDRLSDKEMDTFLRAGDVVIANKGGSVGKVAIVPDHVPPAGPDGWIANQSCMVLRVDQQIDPKSLFLYLRSDVGQTLLAEIVSGATIPMIQLKLLRNLPVIIPTEQEASEIRKTFDNIVDLQSQVETLHQQQHDLSKLHWGIQGLE